MGSTTKAVSYLRVSGKGQIEGDGLPRQRDTIAGFAKRAGYELVGEYRDEGVSGAKDLDDREGLSDLLARIRSNGVRTVLVERADRLARDLLVGEVILGQFRELGAQVVAADSGTELTAGDDDPTRVLIRQVLGAVAQFEKAVVVSKLKAARMRKRRATGRCEGRKPYGARPGEAEVVAVIRRLRRKPRGGERLSFAAIAERLNAECHPSRTGKPWGAETVRRIAMREART
jgi:DNA invertase Pin-like site-specific DNA recombinase